MNKIEELIILTESLRRKEYDYIDDDPWYSCPVICECDLIRQNTKVDKILQLLHDIKEKIDAIL